MTKPFRISDKFLPGETRSSFYRRRSAWQDDFVAWIGEVDDAHGTLSEADAAAFEGWERLRESGALGEASMLDWPEWPRIVGRPRPVLEGGRP